jgi:hypothetical protein
MSSNPTSAAKCLQTGLISAGRWDRRRGFREEVSPACCRYRVSARAFPGLHQQADIKRRPTSPVLAERFGPLSGGSAFWRNGAPWRHRLHGYAVIRARGRRRLSRWRGGRRRGLCVRHPRYRTNKPERMSECFICMQENGRHARRFRTESGDLRICDSGSARNAPSAASGGVR